MMSDEAKTEDTESVETPENAAPEEATPEDTILRLEAEKEEMRGQLLRTLADLDNTRKRAQKEVADARVYAIEKFAADLLSVSDNLARALAALPDGDRDALSEAGKNLLGGIEMTEKELHTALARNGVSVIAALPGDAFDPNLHQAVANVPSPQAPGTIHDVFQTGWKIGDRVLRAAMVAVSAGSTN
ncbi:nucleotide exchange factor GrpE [Hyphomonas sp. ND6WE1B]|jgi:molecular chaperone GrpE|uniref:nucleotide exchange factor GrpE n=2 Tax=Hyphomonas TaxID=85 RepID=UPI000A6BE55A|nr:nucleotide exchange factor GrpE [Hyphomonas sp. ND6WE1B]